MKKNILFIINNLECGGAEKALISLLECIDNNKYQIDLLLFNKKGLFLESVPKTINIIDYNEEMKYFDMSTKEAFLKKLKKKDILGAINRILFSISFKLASNNAEAEQKSWKYISRSIKSLEKKYDVAIGYLEKNPIYFCVDKVNAKKKIGFIHSDYNKLGMKAKYDLTYFDKLDKIIGVSEESVNILKDIFKMYSNKIEVMYNIVNPYTIKKMSNENIFFNKSKISIVTVGRLTKAKGYELAIDACRLLVENNFDIIWYVIGQGEEEKNLKQLIEKNNLEERFILLGLKPNPYPYIKNCDIYVQTSLYEGRCLTLSEAKILCKPIVSTDFNVVYDQINHKENGLIVSKNPKSIYNGIKEIIENDELKQKMVTNLKNEEYEKYQDIDKFYKIIEEKEGI